MAESLRSDRFNPYPTARARQACENCRRKKAKCPGEKPECSFCVRLQQKCVYSHRRRTSRDGSEDHDNQPDRISAIENRLDQIASVIQAWRPPPAEPRQASHSSPLRADPTPLNLSSPLSNVPTRFSYNDLHQIQLPDAVVVEGIQLFFSNFFNQPYPLLAHIDLAKQPTTGQIPSIVLLPLLALSLRSSQHALLEDKAFKRQIIEELTEKSWNFLCKAYSDFAFDLAYFEGLCLLALVDFADGRSNRAHVQVALGLRLAQTLGMLRGNLSTHARVDRTRAEAVVWTLFLIDRMFVGRKLQHSSVPASMYEIEVFQGGPSWPNCVTQPTSSHKILDPLESKLAAKPLSIISINIELIRIWEDVLRDINHASVSTEVPFWRHDSSRASIMTKLLEFDMLVEPHGYVSTGSPMRVQREPGLKGYFRSWIFFQVLVCTIYCCLNHPFIIFIKTSGLKSRVPLTLLQKSYKEAMIHANWVYRLISEMEEARITVHEPFLGFLVAISASIHLEHTLSKYPTLINSAKHKFKTCMGFVKRLADEWPIMQHTASTLEQLEMRLQSRPNMNYVEEEYDGAVPYSNDRQISLEKDDIQLMWNLFNYQAESDNAQLGRANVDHAPNSTTTRIQVNNIPTQNAHPHFLSTDRDSNTESEAFDDLIGDWSLFGRPWEAYFPLETQSEST